MLRARYRHIVWFFARVTAGLIVWELLLLRLGLRRRVERTRPARLQRIAAGFRELAVRLGGVMIKVGQFLSARLDVLPEEITAELARLQDEVPAEDWGAIRPLVEAELGASLDERFVEFAPEPLAAASLGQVHRATIVVDGVVQRVVVKVQRPGIEHVVATDLAALGVVTGWLRRYPPIRRRVDLPALLGEFTRTLNEEIDYLHEGRNAETFAAHFAARPGVRVPFVVWTHTTRRVLTLEDVYAIKITDYAAIDAAGVDRTAVAQRLLDTYLRQIFEDGFFHADPHPGNLFVEPGEGGEWRLTFVDFGMAGQLPPNLRAGLRELLLGLGTRDAARLVKSYQMLGILLPHADVRRLEQVEAKAFERFWGKSVAELRQIKLQEMHDFAHEFRDLVYELPFQIPQNLLLLGRAMAILFGMCSGLDPEFDFFASLVPFMEKLVAEEARTDWRFWLGELGQVGRSLLVMPRRVDALLERVERGELAVQTPQMSAQMTRMERSLRRMTGGIVFAALLTGGVQLLLAGQTVAGWALLSAAGLTLLWMMVVRAG